MSDTSNTPNNNEGAAPVPAGFEPLTPDDDFGQDLVAEFQRRGGGSLSMTPDGGDADVQQRIAEQLEQAFAAPSAEDRRPAPVAAEAAGTAPATPERPAGSMPAGPVPADGEPLVDDPGAGSAGDSGAPSAEADPGGYVWNWTDDQTQAPMAQRFTDDQVQNALRIASDPRVTQGIHLIEWAQQLSPGQREAMARIVSNQGVIVDRAEHDRYQAWLHSQQTANRYPDLDQFDPEAARIIREQQAELARLAEQQPQQGYQEDPQQAQLTHGYNMAFAGVRDSWKLSSVEFEWLYNQASPFVAGLQAQYSHFNPITGMLDAPADPTRVVHEAFSYAIQRNPALHEAVLARTSRPTDPAAAGGGSPAQTLPARDVGSKRAKASSVAAAPSAAVTPAPRSVRQMTEQEVNEAMAAVLTGAMNGDGQGS